MTEDAVQPHDAAVSHGEATIAEPDLSHGDEMMVLIAGFAFGMLIAGIFLVYVVLSAARLLT